jgi:hypothetical protein
MRWVGALTRAFTDGVQREGPRAMRGMIGYGPPPFPAAAARKPGIIRASEIGSTALLAALPAARLALPEGFQTARGPTSRRRRTGRS